MNTNHLKRFAQEARKKLLAQVGAKLSFVLSTDSPELREKLSAVKQLRVELERTSKEQLIEKVAYTWFNRLMALRFMDANDYQPLGIRVITPKDGYTIPELLDEAKRGNIPEELKVNRQKIYDLLDNKIPSNNPQNEAYKELLIASCNHLHTTFPFLFEKINDYTELLLPDDLTSDFSIVKDVREGMPMEDCTNVEIIGWMYQFYISEKKDEVFASKSKVKKEDIPAATQLFTPRWIVEYMVQNTLGKLWLQNRPKSRLREHMPYFIESASLEAEDYLKIQSPEEIKFLDPASGSGHILVYAFDLYTKIYEEEGYNTSEIPNLIIEKNLFGYEIDERAAQLSALALMMKAREYQRRAFRQELRPNILCYQDLNVSKLEIKEFFGFLKVDLTEELMHDLLLMQEATNLGSLIIPHSSKNEIVKIIEKLTSELIKQLDFFQKNTNELILHACKQLVVLSNDYSCIVSNPPYMGRNNMNDALWNYLNSNFSRSCEDTMTCFMEMATFQTTPLGLIGMINVPSWLTLKSFASFREYLIDNVQFETIIHNGRGIFGADFGTITFTLTKNNRKEKKLTIIKKLFIKFSNVDSLERKREKFFNPDYIYNADFTDFKNLPDKVFAYWLTPPELQAFREYPSCNDLYHVKQGMATGENDRFLRYWHEVSHKSIGYGFNSINQALCSDKIYFPYNKGGAYKKWYGNIDYIIKFDRNSYNILNNQGNKIPSKEFQFKTSVTWSKVTAGKFSVRYRDDGALFDVSGCSIFRKENSLFIPLALLNSNLNISFLENISTSVNYEVGQVKAFPFHYDINSEYLIQKVKSCVDICKEELYFTEENPIFKCFPIFKTAINGSIEDSCLDFVQLSIQKENSLNSLEIEIDDFILSIYNLNRTAKLNKSIIYEWVKSGSLKFNTTFFTSIISFYTGCVFGRFSLDKEGFILASHGETLEDYLRKIEKSESECTFLPDDDNIIPILDDEWFEDDIVGRFYQFLKVTFGEKNFSKNLAFIEEQIGKDIRKYFLRDFYTDHIKRYKKRPIYWLFSSPKGSFNALIYMHRYTPDTVSNILNKYLKEFIGKLKTRKEHLQHVQVTGSASEINKAIKEIDGIDKTLMELQEYERDILYPLATERIAIDLDDGVLVNYNKFGKAVKEVAGLNDKKTKDKVRGFDWIDTTQIK